MGSIGRPARKRARQKPQRRSAARYREHSRSPGAAQQALRRRRASCGAHWNAPAHCRHPTRRSVPVNLNDSLQPAPPRRSCRILRGGFPPRRSAVAGALFTAINLATCYSSLGDYDRAIRIYASSVALYERSGAKFYLQLSLGETGHTPDEGGEIRNSLSAAGTQYRQRNGQHADAASWAGNLSAVYSELGDWPNAEASTRKRSAWRIRPPGYPLLQQPEPHASRRAGRF